MRAVPLARARGTVGVREGPSLGGDLKAIVAELARRQAYVTSDELSLATGLTPRRVRSVISSASAALGRSGVRIDAAPRKGYRLKGSPEAISRVLRSDDAEESRLQEVLEILLMADGYVKLDELADTLFVSRSTMNRLMRTAREVLAQHGLKLVARPYHGLRVEGAEYERRLCAAEWCGTGASREPGIPSLLLKRPEDAERVRAIEEILRASLKSEGLELGDFAFYNLVVHIYIALLRVEHGEYVSVPMEVEATDQEQRGAEAIARGVADRFGIDLPAVETAYLVIHLKGKRMLDVSDSTMITSEVEGLVREMNERVYARLGIDVRDDLELFVALGLHLVPCLSRMRYGLRTENPLLDEIKTNMRTGFECALAAASVIGEHCGAPLPEDEVGYFAMHYALACERRGARRAVRVLLCCATGAGTVRYLKRKIERQYGVGAEQIDTASIHDLDRIDLSAYGVALSTVPVPREYAGRVTYLENIFSEDLPDPAASEAGASRAAGLLAPGHVLVRSEATREGAIRELCALVQDDAVGTDDLTLSVLERERSSSTALGNMVAIPHPGRLVTSKSHLFAMIVQAPIDWGGKPVRVVFLVVLSKCNRAEGEEINDALLDFAMDAEKVLAFLRQPSPERLVASL